MKNFIHNFIYIVIPGFFAFIFFSLSSVTSNAEALPVYGLDSSAFQVLQGGSNQAINYYGMNDPSSYLLFGIGQQIYNDVDNYLYTNYGYDFQDMGWAMEDSWKDGSVASALADNFAYNIGGFNSMAEAISNGYIVASTYGKSLLTGAKQYIMGKFDNDDQLISDVKDNVYTKITDSYIDKLNNATNHLVYLGDIIDLSNGGIYYGKNFSVKIINWGINSDTYILNIYLSDYAQLSYDSINHKIGFSSFANTLTATGELINSNNQVFPATITLTSNNPNSFGYSIGSVNYNGFWIYRLVGDGWSASPVVEDWSSKPIDYNFNSTDLTYKYLISDFNELSTLLDNLKNTWVTSDDLRSIEEKIDDLTLGNIIIDDDSTPVIDTDNTALADLQSLIQELLNKNADLSNYLNSLEDSSDPEPDPTPDPDLEYNDQGISIPPDFDNDLFTNTFSVFKLPFNFFSIFEPIFYSFGSFAMMFGLFQFVPFALIVLVLIWVLK